jgi:8-oxo-dGTP diphosphatase
VADRSRGDGGTALVTAGILVRDDRVFLARRAPGYRLAGYWELPGGKIEAGETPEACLARELAEECGIEVIVGPLFAESLHRYPHATIQLLAFRIASWRGEMRLHAHDAFVWVSPDDLQGMLVAPADLPILAALASELS